MIWRFRGREMTFEKVRVMGILNVTPDSFSDGGKFFSSHQAVERALEMEQEGADVIDVGGESTRPGAHPISETEELERILPVIRGIRSQSQIPLSIDTTKPGVARLALQAGADIVNDVDGLEAASGIAQVVREFNAGLILMHRRGTSETMQSLTHYENVVEEVFGELDRSFEEVMDHGVLAEQIVLDPGIGFSKTGEQNLEILNRLSRFLHWNRPLLVGPSRKSFIGNLTAREPFDRDWGSAAAVALAVDRGTHLVRVHNVRAMKDVVRVSESIIHSRGESHVRS